MTLDPANVLALVDVAVVDLAVAVLFAVDDRAALLAAAETALTKALSLAPESALAHLCLGVVQTWTNRASQGIRRCERALELDRNLAGAHAHIGGAKLHLGQAEETEAHIHEALRLSPRDRLAYMWCTIAGLAKLYVGKEKEAVGWLRRSIEINRDYPSSHFLLAAALAHLGRIPEARSAAQVGLAFNPTFTISRYRSGASNESPAAVAGTERLIDGLRKAGVPEG